MDITLGFGPSILGSSPDGSTNAHEHANCLACGQGEKAGSIFVAQLRRSKSRGGVATSEAEAEESCDRVLTGAQA